MRDHTPLPVDPDAVHYVFSGNWSAVIGVAICLVALFSWAHYRFNPIPEEDA